MTSLWCVCVWGKMWIGATRLSLGDPLLPPLSIYILTSASPTANHRTFVAFVGICLGHSPHLFLPASSSSLFDVRSPSTSPPRSEKSPRQRDPHALKLAFEIFSADVISGDGSCEAGARPSFPFERLRPAAICRCEWIPVGLSLSFPLVISSRFVTAVELDSP